jgi:asparagine synthase (glutamine-hydrolysing)
MRLICGVFHLDGAPANDDRLDRMVARMDVPRLRPSVRTWREGPVGLAVLEFSPCRAPGPPPAWPERDGSIMVADVRLDEPDTLRRALGLEASTADDDAVLLAALDRLGPSGLDRVLGDFAFARWNRHTQCLTCGRDVFGIRPLSYVYQPGKLFAFASLPTALHGAGLVPKRIDPDALVRRLARVLRFDDSLIAGIARLPPAHVIEVGPGGLSLRRYWRLDRRAVGSRTCTPQDAARDLGRLVDRAVACRLPRGGDIGAHLSGGLDSSAIAVLAARHLRGAGRTLHAYSFLDRPRHDIALEDETDFVKAVVEQEGDIDWTPIPPPLVSQALNAPVDADTMAPLGADEPEQAVCARAEAQGVGLVLSGWGGDEAASFNGRGTFAELLLRGRWRTLAREVAARKLTRGVPVSRILYGEIVAYLVPEAAIDLARRIAGKPGRPNRQRPPFLSAEARRRLAASGRDGLRMGPDGRTNRWRLITSPHLAHRAETWAETGARYGLAFAFPLLDRRVVEFALSLPSALFVRDGFRRRPFRDAMAGVLTESVRWRHQKYVPFPGRLLDLVESRGVWLQEIDRYERHDTVRRLIDLAALRQFFERFPSADAVRREMRGNDRPAAAMSLLDALQALRMAAYLEQHGDDGFSPARSSLCPTGRGPEDPAGVEAGR